MSGLSLFGFRSQAAIRLMGCLWPMGYCSTSNDDKFDGSTTQVKALRDYVCDRSDASTYFHDGLNKYLDAKGIPRATNE
jgi:hypothetical protein